MGKISFKKKIEKENSINYKYQQQRTQMNIGTLSGVNAELPTTT